MATTRVKLSPIIHWKDQWEEGKSYKIHAVVANNGSSFIATVANPETEPTVTYDAENETYIVSEGWALMAYGSTSDLAATVAEHYAAQLVDEAVVAEHLASLFAEIQGLAAMVDQLGDARARSLSIDTMLKICGSDIVIFGTAAPSVIPDFKGQIYIDTTGKVFYAAMGNASASDWLKLTKDAELQALITTVGGKVDKVNGKALSTNDYNDTEKALNASNKSRLDVDEVVLAEHLASIIYELKGIFAAIDNFGDARARSLTIDTMLKICGSSLILTGSGAPSAIPDFVGQEYLDTTSKKAYKAFGKGSVSDWVALN